MENNNEYIYLIFHHWVGYDTYSSWHTIQLVMVMTNEILANKYIKNNKRKYGYYELKKVKNNEEVNETISHASL